jgi:hypothetical protein
MRLALLALLIGAPLNAQLIDWGVKGGFPFTDAVSASGAFKAASANWTVGPTVDINLPLGFGVEFDALYRTVGYSGPLSDNSAGSWSFPLLAKYKFPGPSMVRLYVSGGYVFRSIGDMTRLVNNGSQGLAFGVGLRYAVKRVRISPELRYTHYYTDAFRATGASGNSLSTSSNQFSFLVGVTF